jgi:hypothetical protein
LCKSCAGRRNFLFFKNQKQKQKPRQIVATQKRKKMKKGVAAAALCKERNKNFARNKAPKIYKEIATRSLRNKHARKVHENCTHYRKERKKRKEKSTQNSKEKRRTPK